MRIVACILPLLVSCIYGLDEHETDTNPNIAFIKDFMTKPDAISLPSGLRYRILREGNPEGKSPLSSSPCDLRYTGRTVDGKVFDSSEKKENGITVLTPNTLIKGFGEALQLMKEGDVWELVIPADIGYGGKKKSRIPAGSTLVFEVELVKVNEPQWFTFKREYIMWAFLFLYFVYNYYQSTVRNKAVERATPVDIESVTGLKGNPVVFMTIAIDDTNMGKIEFELFPTVCPRTVENFRCLCTGEKGMTKSGKTPLHFKGCGFHRIIPGFMCQGGDFTCGNGTGGESIYGGKFEDEFDNGMIPHSVPMLLSMANAGPNTNGSQFFITLDKTPWLDGKHVVFGRVKSGAEVVKAMEAAGTSSGKTRMNVVILESGQLETVSHE
mmetsp:Transcript_6202/g.9351  ORF Transcript_6202/g.9351 Transcript_6202/m.9351 type:complete len:382 (+) Transcript_6202:72-1217(+)